MKTIVLAVVAALVGSASFGAEPALTDGVLTVAVTEGSRSYTTDELAAITAAGPLVTNIVKTGSGTLVSSGIASYKGAIDVQGGILEIVDATGLGTIDGGTTIGSDATLKCNSGSQHGIWLGCRNEPLTFKGSTTRDALQVVTESVFFESVKLEGDTTFRSDVTLYLGTSSGKTIDMGGNTLTIAGPTSGSYDLYFGFANVLNPGNLTVEGFNFFYESAALTGGSSHVLTLSGRPHIRFEDYDKGADWTLRMNGTGSFYAKGATNVWEGPIELGTSSRSFVILNAGDFRIKGGISGSAAMSLDQSSTGARLSLFGQNTYTGSMAVNAGCVYLASAQTVPSLTANPPQYSSGANGDSLIFEPVSEAHPDGWSASDLWKYFDSYRTFGRSRPYFKINVPKGEVYEMEHDFNNEDYRTQNIGTTGGEIRFIGAYQNSPRFCIRSEGPVVLTSPTPATAQTKLGGCYVDLGSLVLRDLGFVQTGGYDFYIRGTSASPTRLVVSGQTVMGQEKSGYWTAQINISQAANGRGTLVIDSGATVTNKVIVGASAGQEGSVLINGGHLYSSARTGNNGQHGGAGKAYLEMMSGSYTDLGYNVLGELEGGVGEMRFLGGAATIETEMLAVGLAGTGILRLSGGTFTSRVALPVCGPAYAASAEGGSAFMTMDGTAAADVATGVTLANRTGGFACLNLNGGAVLETPRIQKGAASGATAYVGFNGGTLKSKEASRQIDILGTDAARPDRVTIYAGGAVFDSNGGEIWVKTPLANPEGGSVNAIALPNGPLSGYLTPPLVRITGNGAGATASADFDAANGTVTGVTVTSPGWGYSGTVTVTLVGCSGKADVSWTVTPSAESAAGGLTKRGEGVLRLTTTNTYAGATVVEGGTLRLGSDWALPKGGEIVLRNGAAFEFNGKTAEVARVTYGVGGGSLVGGTAAVFETATPSFIVSVDELLDGRSLSWTGNIDLSLSTLTITGDLSRLATGSETRYRVLSVSNGVATGEPTIVSGSLPEGWKFSVGRSGVRLVKTMGLTLIVR